LHPLGWRARFFPDKKRTRLIPLFPDARPPKEPPMEFTITAASLQPIVALIAGIVILIFPRILNYVIALYLIVFGILGLFPNLFA
jgi:DUF3096 family protein